jgi:Spy/CpxP family protein refolding chaperone
MEQLQRLSETLSLTQEQKDQITAIIKGNAPQRQAIMNDASLTPEDRRAKMRELMKGTPPKIRALLTTEQQQKFDAMPRPEFGRGPRHGGPHNPPPPGGNPPPPDAPPAAGSPPPPANSL